MLKDIQVQNNTDFCKILFENNTEYNNYTMELGFSSNSAFYVTIRPWSGCFSANMTLYFRMLFSKDFQLNYNYILTNENDSISLPKTCNAPISEGQQQVISTTISVQSYSSTILESACIVASSVNIDVIASSKLFALVKYMKIEYPDFMNNHFHDEEEKGLMNSLKKKAWIATPIDNFTKKYPNKFEIFQFSACIWNNMAIELIIVNGMMLADIILWSIAYSRRKKKGKGEVLENPMEENEAQNQGKNEEGENKQEKEISPNERRIETENQLLNMKAQGQKNSPPPKTEKQLDGEEKGENLNWISSTEEFVNSVDSPEKAIHIPKSNEIKNEAIAKQKNDGEEQKSSNLQVSSPEQGKLTEEQRNKKTVQIGENWSLGRKGQIKVPCYWTVYLTMHSLVLSFVYSETVNFSLSIWYGWKAGWSWTS